MGAYISSSWHPGSGLAGNTEEERGGRQLFFPAYNVYSIISPQVFLQRGSPLLPYGHRGNARLFRHLVCHLSRQKRHMDRTRRRSGLTLRRTRRHDQCLLGLG